MHHSEGNILKNLPDSAREEICTILHSTKNIRIEHIVSSGQTSPETGWYDQDEQEWVVLLEGDAQIEFEDSRIIHIYKGDYLLIEAHQKHKVIYTSTEPSCVWLAVFFQ